MERPADAIAFPGSGGRTPGSARQGSFRGVELASFGRAIRRCDGSKWNGGGLNAWLGLLAHVWKAGRGAAMGTATMFRAQLVMTMLEFERLTLRLSKLEKLDPILYQRFIGVYETELAKRGQELGRLSSIRSEPTRGDWQILAETKAKCDELMNESLSFVYGALIRRAELDDGLCAIADNLLDGLSDASGIAWGRLCVPAESEFFNDLAQIVRLRAGDVSIWNLPVAAHEFGHFIGPRISARGRYPFAEQLSRYRAGTQEWLHLREHFADIFATYVVGPSFVSACILSRFDTTDATEPRETHPSARDRVFIMFRVLREMDATRSAPPVYKNLLSRLEGVWEAILKASGSSSELSPHDRERLEDVFAPLYKILSDNLPGLRYEGMTRAHAVKRAIQNDLAALPNPAGIADVLNGAWLLRVATPAADLPSLRIRAQTALRFAQQAVAT
jgi:hypothetical protein